MPVGGPENTAPRSCVALNRIDCDNRGVRPEKLGRLLMRAGPLLNAPVTALATSPRFGKLVNRNIAVLTYTGRRSGRTFSHPGGIPSCR
jgi:hypothetical protein